MIYQIHIFCYLCTPIRSRFFARPDLCYG